MDVATLGHAGAALGAGRQRISIDEGDPAEERGDRLGGAHTGDAPADHDDMVSLHWRVRIARQVPSHPARKGLETRSANTSSRLRG
jgi:hypothetical protein